MTTGLILAGLSLVTGAGTIASYYPKMQSNQATLRRRRQAARNLPQSDAPVPTAINAE